MCTRHVRAGAHARERSIMGRFDEASARASRQVVARCLSVKTSTPMSLAGCRYGRVYISTRVGRYTRMSLPISTYPVFAYPAYTPCVSEPAHIYSSWNLSYLLAFVGRWSFTDSGLIKIRETFSVSMESSSSNLELVATILLDVILFRVWLYYQILNICTNNLSN